MDTDRPLFLVFSTNLLAALTLPRMVMLPVEAMVEVVSMEPLVLIVVEPPIREAPLIVPLAITVLFKVLLLRVSVASRTTTVPEVGNTAEPLTPVPPLRVGKVLVTAALLDRSIAPNSGPVAPTRNT